MAFIGHGFLAGKPRLGRSFVGTALVQTSPKQHIYFRRARPAIVMTTNPDQKERTSKPSIANGVPDITANDQPLSDDEASSIESIDDPFRAAQASHDMIRPNAAKDIVADEEESNQGPSDAIRIGGVGVVVAVIAALLEHSWVQDHLQLAMTGIFVLGYVGIILEEAIAFDKTGVALLMGVGVWTVLMTDSGGGEAAHHVKELLSEQLGDISQILFFLIGAMTIVEIIDAHRGFKVVTDFITTNNRKMLLWTIGILTFFVSAVLDNLTSTIVIVSLLRKLVADEEDRWLYGAVVVVAANAGGAWTPIGDVTTTQLWVHGNITAFKTMKDLFLPSFVSLLTSLAFFTPMVGEGEFERPDKGAVELAPRAGIVFWTGLAALISVPVFKSITGLPPYLGMLSGLGTLWVMTDALHAGENRESLRGLAAVKRIDTSGVLFFLGILLAVGGLESAGLLSDLAHYLDANFASRELIATAIGLLSSVVDNVPLVAATMGMYSLEQVPQDSDLWQLIAFCAGTGGSILIIGSAAGVAFMYVRPSLNFTSKPCACDFDIGLLTPSHFVFLQM